MVQKTTRTGLILGLLSLGALTLGALIFFEFIRPFRDSHIDIPIALSAGAAGALLSAGSLILRRGATILNAVALGLNLTGLTAVIIILRSLAHMKIM